LLDLNQIEDVLQARLNHRGNSYLSRANASAMSKHRLRMLMLYQKAEINNWLVVGAANRTEWLTGTFSKWGCDHCADLMPLLHLYRTQVEQLAEFLEVPARIREKTADPDILPGVNDKEALLGSFEESDLILLEFEERIALGDIKLRHNPQTVERIFKLFQLSTPMRAIPYQLARE
jgi:NAD+ synthase